MTGRCNMPEASAAFALVALVGCGPEVPANPTYSNDVRPIFMAHCVRCHGANDSLNIFPESESLGAPSVCYLQRFEDTGDCVAAVDCKRGAGFCGTLMAGSPPGSYISTRTIPSKENAYAPEMPPPSAEPLNAWEIEVIDRWLSIRDANDVPAP
jgi:hypothetical protein